MENTGMELEWVVHILKCNSYGSMILFLACSGENKGPMAPFTLSPIYWILIVRVSLIMCMCYMSKMHNPKQSIIHVLKLIMWICNKQVYEFVTSKSHPIESQSIGHNMWILNVPFLNVIMTTFHEHVLSLFNREKCSWGWIVLLKYIEMRLKYWKPIHYINSNIFFIQR